MFFLIKENNIYRDDEYKELLDRGFLQVGNLQSAIGKETVAYAGTYHHLYHKGSHTVGVAPEKAIELYEDMMREKRYLEENNILCLVQQNAEKIRGKLNIKIHIGTAS